MLLADNNIHEEVHGVVLKYTYFNRYSETQSENHKRLTT